MLLFVHLAGCLCLSLAYSIYTFSAPPHPSRRLISNPVCPARRNPGFYFVLFFFFLADNNYRQGWPGLRAHPLQRHIHTCRHTHTHTRVERGRGRETGVGSGMRHALIFYYLFSISFSITLSAHFVCRSHAAYSFVLLFCSPIRSCLGGGRAGSRTGVLSTLRALSALLCVRTLVANLMCTHCRFGVENDVILADF